jgi:P27 family predicted phage terminase small subunit
VAKGRPADPTRARRGTGNRPKAGQVKGKEIAVLATPAGPSLPEPPEDLPGPAAEMFRRATAELANRGLKDVDLEALTMMCWSAYVHAEARQQIARTGVLVKGPRGPMVNPMVKVARDEAATFLRIANEFGFTLAARLRLGLMQLAGESLLASMNKDLDDPSGGVGVSVRL